MAILFKMMHAVSVKRKHLHNTVDKKHLISKGLASVSTALDINATVWIFIGCRNGYLRDV